MVLNPVKRKRKLILSKYLCADIYYIAINEVVDLLRERIRIVVENIDANMQHQKGLFPTKKGANPTICRKEWLNPTKGGQI